MPIKVGPTAFLEAFVIQAVLQTKSAMLGGDLSWEENL
jgi:hypothetical protein